jgi:catechol 2,3-dioxygenase-like lactoylglutathione lyase family enzyme
VKLRVARHTDRLEEVVAFYRDRVGLPELGRFEEHDGYDGVFLDLPGTGAHLEFTCGGGHVAPPADPEALLVLYLESEAERDALATQIGPGARVTPANPYWQVNGIAFADPDDCQLILALE